MRPERGYIAAWRRLLAAGQARLLLAEHEGVIAGGLLLYLQGGMHSTAYSADRAELRHSLPGTMHLVRWTVIRDALAEGVSAVELGGVDLPGHREPPGPDEPNHGLYVHKVSFGAQWVVRTPARRLVLRPGAVRVADTRDLAVGLGRKAAAAIPGRPAVTARPLAGLVARLETRDELRSVLGSAADLTDVSVGGVTHDSRHVRPGDLFVAVPGAHHDGHDHAPAAIEAGASALVLERAVPAPGVPQLLVRAARPALASAAAWFEGDPSHRLGVVGITGTDGKTTTSYLVRSMLEACGLPTGMLGTIDVVVAGESLGNPGRATTPEAPELQAHLRAMADGGDRFAVVEATSHGLAQDRVAEVAWDVAVHTNVTHEHLEFHRTPEAYRAAKRRLFERLATGPANPDKGLGKHAVVNRDDPWAPIFLDAARDAGASIIGYGAAPGAEADIRAIAVREGRRLEVTVRTRRWQAPVRLALAGRYNVHNALAAIGVGEALDLDPEAMRAGLEALDRVPGRMEPVDLGQPFRVLVDYAHSPEALAKALDAIAPLAAAGGGGLIAVFGSAGDRDTAKRPMMGRVAGERCRLVVVTDEDPRSEDREAILDAIAEGAEHAGRVRGHDLLLVADRRGSHRGGDRPGAPGGRGAAGRQGPRADHRDRRGPHRVGRGGGRACRAARAGLRRATDHRRPCRDRGHRPHGRAGGPVGRHRRPVAPRRGAPVACVGRGQGGRWLATAAGARRPGRRAGGRVLHPGARPVRPAHAARARRARPTAGCPGRPGSVPVRPVRSGAAGGRRRWRARRPASAGASRGTRRSSSSTRPGRRGATAATALAAGRFVRAERAVQVATTGMYLALHADEQEQWRLLNQNVRRNIDRCRKAEVEVVRFDADSATDALDAALATAYRMLVETGERRGFADDLRPADYHASSQRSAHRGRPRVAVDGAPRRPRPRLHAGPSLG